MYAKDHALAGAVIAITVDRAGFAGHEAIALVTAFGVASHLALDLINEASFPSLTITAISEALFIAALVAATWFSPLVLVGIVAANLPDIWDSRGYLTYINRKRWPHLHHWPCHQKGYARVKLTQVQNVALTTFAYLAFFNWILGGA